MNIKKYIFIAIIIFIVGLIFVFRFNISDDLNYTVAIIKDKKEASLLSSELNKYLIKNKIVEQDNSYTIKVSNTFDINKAKIKLIFSDKYNGKIRTLLYFDKSVLGTKSFKDKEEYLKTLENSLSKTLEYIPNILSAKVKIKLSKILVTLKFNNANINKKHIGLIKKFVSSSMPQVTKSDVIIYVFNKNINISTIIQAKKLLDS